jgi:hypothetical protein
MTAIDSVPRILKLPIPYSVGVCRNPVMRIMAEVKDGEDVQ